MNDKILLIEDDRTMLSLLGTLLRFEGFEVATLHDDNSQDAVLDAIHQENPEVILLDVHLRTLNGLDLLRAIRSDDRLNETCVIMSSGSDLGERCKEQGANAFIMKPYMPDDLIRVIRQVLSDN